MSVPLYQKVYADLLKDIQEKKYIIGDKLPTNKQLAEKYGVSTIVCKQALDLLFKDGMVERIRGKGTFLVADSKTGKIEKRAINIGCILTDFDVYASDLLHGIEEVLSNNGANLILKLSKGESALESKYIKELADTADGIIIMPVQNQYYNPDLLELVVNGFPLILIDRRLKEIPSLYVCTDNIQACKDLTNQLISEGKRNIGIVTPNAVETSAIEDRLQGYSQALNEQSIKVDESFFLRKICSTIPNQRTEAFIEQDLELIKQYLLANKGRLDAIIALGYNIALLIQRAIDELKLPELHAIELACFDEPYNIFLPQARYTHIMQQEKKMGAIASQKLLALIAGESHIESELIPGILVKKAEKVGS